VSVDLEGAAVDCLAQQLDNVRVVRHLRDADWRRLSVHLTYAVHRHQHIRTGLAHADAHTHCILTAILPRERGLAGCPLNSPSPFSFVFHVE